MKLALYLPNFRDEVTVKELEDLTGARRGPRLRLRLDARPDRRAGGVRSRGAAVPVRHDDRVPQRPAGHLARRVVPGHDADPLARREDHEGPDRDEHHRHAVPRARRARRRTRHPGPPVQRPAQRRRRLRLDARGVRRRERRPHVPAPARSTCARRSRSCRASGPTTSSSTTASSPTSSSAGSVTSRCRSHTRRSTSAGSRTRSARRGASRSTACRAGSASRTRRTTSRGGAPTSQRELEELGELPLVDDLDICSMIWFVITDEEIDQTPAGKATNLLVGTAEQIDRHPQALQGGRADDAAAVAAVPRRADVEDARRPQASARRRSCPRSRRCRSSASVARTSPS